MASATGTATLDFGSTPTTTATVAVTGQTGIGTNSHVDAFTQATDSTADHGATEHMIRGLFLHISAGNVVAGTGFTIYGVSQFPLRGQWKIHWVWAD